MFVSLRSASFVGTVPLPLFRIFNLNCHQFPDSSLDRIPTTTLPCYHYAHNMSLQLWNDPPGTARGIARPHAKQRGKGGQRGPGP